MSAARLLSLSVLVATLAPPTVPPPANQYAHVNGVRLQYVDWGGPHRNVLLFLSSAEANSHEFDSLAPQFVDRFHVLGLTRRGQGLSDAPPSGYDTATLVNDILAFLVTKGIDRVTLVGYEIAGQEETLFASTYPARVNKLVYLDATFDPRSAYELEMSRATGLPPGFREPVGTLGMLSRGARAADPDYTNVVAPALAFCVHSSPFEEQGRQHFRHDMRNGRIVELRHTSRKALINDPGQQAIVVREMRSFFTGRPRPDAEYQ